MTSFETNFSVRCPIRLTIVDKQTNKAIFSTYATSRSKIRSVFIDWLEQNSKLSGTWLGKCRVTYNISLGIWNESLFTDYKSFDIALAADTQKELLLGLKNTGEIDPVYIQERKQLSLAL